MNMRLPTAAGAFAAALALAQPALAAPGDPVPVGDGLSFDPIVEGRIRWEHVDTPTVDADAVTARLRAGFELKHESGLSFLAEGEGTLAIDGDYNAFPFAIADAQRRPRYAVVADAQNVDLNRLQLQYKGKAGALTVGRQRINLDDQRWVGSVAWRQSEQTFDAVRAEAKLGPVTLDGTYAISQRTVFGNEAGPRAAYDGDFVFLGAGAKLGPVQVKAFSYLLDYEAKEQLGPLAITNADTQSYGVRATAAFPLSKTVKLNLIGSYARQWDWKDNPADYAVDYVLGEGTLAFGPLSVLGGYEKLGSDNGRALQTPMATLHKFNGFADLFLTTPPTGLEDAYAGAAYKFEGVEALPGLNATVTWHQFDSDVGNIEYGTEWDATLGFKIRQFAVLAKYANYDAQSFGADTEKFWLQFEFSY